VRYVCTTGVRRRLRDVVLRADAGERFVLREDLARRYLVGNGIEIGPAFWPLRVLPGVGIRYVDHVSREDLVRDYAQFAVIMNLDLGAIPRVDIIDDAERLQTLGDESQDFVIANHVVEHTEDPIATLETLLRVIRSGGILFLTLPDARRMFDAPRPRTTVEHLLRDHREGPEESRRGHYEEWAEYIEGATGEGIATRADEFAAEGARHHFHVWELETFLALLGAVELPCVIELAQTNGEEFAVILRKT
jgi:SAM-dependent methyltransferase